jgi:hypothetical protein
MEDVFLFLKNRTPENTYFLNAIALGNLKSD